MWLVRTLLQLLPDEPEAQRSPGADALLRSAATGAARRERRLRADVGAGRAALVGGDARTKRSASSRPPLRGSAPAAFSSKPRSSRPTSKAFGAVAPTGARSRCLYEGLVRATPTVGAFVGRAAAIAEADSPFAGLAALDRIDPSSTKSYQPYWAVRAHLLRRAGRVDEALGAFDRAIGLTEDAATRRFLLGRRAELPLPGI